MNNTNWQRVNTTQSSRKADFPSWTVLAWMYLVEANDMMSWIGTEGFLTLTFCALPPGLGLFCT